MLRRRGGGLVRPTLGGVASRPQWITAAVAVVTATANIALNNPKCIL